MSDRALNILRHVVAPIAIAAISGFVAVQTAREHTKMSYEALAPAVRDLQDQVAKLSGRVEELSKETRVIVMRAEAEKPAKAKLLGGVGHGAAGLGATKVEVQVDAKPALLPEVASPPVQQKRPAAKFDDMLKGM